MVREHLGGDPIWCACPRWLLQLFYWRRESQVSNIFDIYSVRFWRPGGVNAIIRLKTDLKAAQCAADLTKQRTKTHFSLVIVLLVSTFTFTPHNFILL